MHPGDFPLPDNPDAFILAAQPQNPRSCPVLFYEPLFFAGLVGVDVGRKEVGEVNSERVPLSQPADKCAGIRACLFLCIA